MHVFNSLYDFTHRRDDEDSDQNGQEGNFSLSAARSEAKNLNNGLHCAVRNELKFEVLTVRYIGQQD